MARSIWPAPLVFVACAVWLAPALCTLLLLSRSQSALLCSRGCIPRCCSASHFASSILPLPCLAPPHASHLHISRASTSPAPPRLPRLPVSRASALPRLATPRLAAPRLVSPHSDTLAVGTSEETELYTVYSLPGDGIIEGEGVGGQAAYECEPLAVLDCPAQQGGIAFDAEDRIAIVGQQVRRIIVVSNDPHPASAR